MYLKPEHVALANQALRVTFEQCCIAWQAIPQWDTGDPALISVSNGSVTSPNVVPVGHQEEVFALTVGQVISPTPDALLTALMTATATLAQKVDADVLPQLYSGAGTPKTTSETSADLQEQIILGRAALEDVGYRAPSCLITNTQGLIKLSQLASGTSILGGLLTAGNINALHRAAKIEAPDDKTRLVLIGRRRRIAPGAAAEASPGEEPVDLAVSQPPSLEVNGETSTGKIQFTVRIRYVLRITDAKGLYAIKKS